MIGVYTNGAYDIFGIVISKKLYGIVIKSKYTSVYAKYEFVEMDMYNLSNDRKPQFVKKVTALENK